MEQHEEAFVKSAAVHILSGLVKINKTIDKQDVNNAVDMAIQLNDELDKRFKQLK
jgi:hypothetical protein